jgi:hypothetical protein
VAVPDGLFPDPEYQHMVQVGGPGPADHPAAGHRVVFVAETFAAVFEEAGFAVTLLEWWDRSGVFNRTDWNIEDGPIYRSSLMDHRNEASETAKAHLEFPVSSSTLFGRLTETLDQGIQFTFFDHSGSDSGKFQKSFQNSARPPFFVIPPMGTYVRVRRTSGWETK